MSGTQVSGAARELAARRWGASKPVRMARELLPRLDELPEVERRALAGALAEHAERERPPLMGDM